MISLKTLQHTLASTRRVAASSPWAIRVLARPTASPRFLSTISASHFKESEDQDLDEEGDVSHAQHYARSTAAASQDPTPYSPSFSSAADTQQTHFDSQRVKLAASRAQTPLSIAQCLRLGDSLGTKSLLKNISFLNRELPVRFSKRIVELRNLPTELRKTEPFMSLVQNYSASFHELQSYSDNSRLCEGIDLEDNEAMQRTIQREYANLLQRVTNRHKQDVVYMAHGISLFKRYQLDRNRPSEEIRHFLNSFNRGRLGIRIMIGHHLALQRQLLFPNAPPASTTNSKRVGIIEPQCDIEALIMNATQSAQFVFFHHYNTVFPPHVHLEHSKELGGKMVRFPVVPALLHHILFELLKNSMRATAEFHGLDKPSYPDILVKLSTTPEGNLSIVIKDHGGGLPQRQITKPFDYMFTTASNTVCLDFPSIISAIESKPQTSATGENLPLCGFGFGLATSKLYAQLFGGDLELQSTPGYGTEAHIQMSRLEDQIEQFTDH
ncbi:hypothetical protein BGW38_002877 [Lunasporangiospora selenospora]|uniref:Protein-serine/threonine kinase n=1 Tax=Lunasporangiospora selenospora TaxID=979761 RepID=A0A9P6FS69_9FUNG|nr:hypothetical protein BGW38_002877 [Lunasporangiospora selenospora]